MADGVRLSDLEPRLICSACGSRGADIRPDFPQAKMGTGQSAEIRCIAGRDLKTSNICLAAGGDALLPVR